jgi:Na+-translocating ferredoxin:NAD+ oxidoreductase RnfD subunit
MAVEQSTAPPIVTHPRPTRTVRLGGQPYPLILPTIRDPRLHVAAVIITIHVLGQIGLGFWVSVPQILAAILASAILEIVITFRQSKALVWPASAMLTGSGVALILRVVGTQPGDHWTFDSVGLYAIVAGASLLSKYVIRYRGSHVFNPSNIGLVVTFVVLGSSRVEPLDFWWAPLNVWMVLAYIVIIVGGLLITRRLRLLALAAVFWIALAGGIGVLSTTGHCIVTRWSFAPVCGVDYWRTIVTSPELLIFLFFMITDPKTVPSSRVGRVLFAALTAVASTLLMAPQTDEFGTKVGLLAGLMVVSAIRPALEGWLPEPKSAADDVRAFARRLLPPRLARAGAAVVFLLAYGTGIVLAGTPARTPVITGSTEVLDRLPTQVDPGTLPPYTVGQDVVNFDPTLAGPGMPEVLVTLEQNLEYENEALLHHDPTILTAVDHGDRLIEMQARLTAAQASETTVLEHYEFASITVRLLVPFGRQDGFSLGLDSKGTVITETYDASGMLSSRASAPFSLTFAVRRATGARWLDVAVLPLPG